MKVLFDDSNFRKLIIDLNQEQLYEYGIDSNGNSLGEYTPYTKQLKQEKGQRIDHITLKDTGDFYNSFQLIFNNSDGSIQIIADGQKEDTNLFREFGIDILGLTEENMDVVVSTANRILQRYIKSYLIAA